MTTIEKWLRKKRTTPIIVYDIINALSRLSGGLYNV